MDLSLKNFIFQAIIKKKSQKLKGKKSNNKVKIRTKNIPSNGPDYAPPTILHPEKSQLESL